MGRLLPQIRAEPVARHDDPHVRFGIDLPQIRPGGRRGADHAKQRATRGVRGGQPVRKLVVLAYGPDRAVAHMGSDHRAAHQAAGVQCGGHAQQLGPVLGVCANHAGRLPEPGLQSTYGTRTGRVPGVDHGLYRES